MGKGKLQRGTESVVAVNSTSWIERDENSYIAVKGYLCQTKHVVSTSSEMSDTYLTSWILLGLYL